MANQWTGDFDAVAQVSVSAINRLLASMHQNGAEPTDLPTLPHRAKIRVGDKPLPSAAAGVRGTIQVQIGMPAISLVAGTQRDAEISCWVRVRYRPDAGTVPLPEFIHGRIVARFRVEAVTVAGTPSLRAIPSSNDADINFVDSGLASGDLTRVNAIVRYLLRNHTNSVLTLPADVPPAATDFRVITDAQNRTAVALPVTVNGNAPASGSFGDVVLDTSAFAIAASSELIVAMVHPAIDAIKQMHPTFTISRKIGWGPVSHTFKATYTISMSAKVSWKGGVLTLHIDGTAETPTLWAPNADFTITQDIHFSCDINAQMVVIAPAGAPDVTMNVHGPFGGLVEGKAESKATNQFIAVRDKALPAAQTALNTLLVQQIDRLRKVLRRIDPAADVWLASCKFDDPGALLRGTIKLSPRLAPRVEFGELEDGSGYTAFKSWVPGGRIKQYKWTWWRNGDPIDPQTTGVIVHKALLDDRFVLQQEKLPMLTSGEPPAEGPSDTPTLPAPSGDGGVIVAGGVGSILDPSGAVSPVWGQACLRVYGEHIDPSTGSIVSVSQDVKFDPALTCTFESGLGKIELPIVPPPKQLIPIPDPFQQGINTLVVTMAPADAPKSFGMIRVALASSERLQAGLLIVVAALAEAASARRLADTAQTHLRGLTRVAVVVADRGSTWLRPAELPSEREPAAFRLIDAAGKLVWRHDGAIDARTMASALKAHLLPTGVWRPGLLRTALRPGDTAPEFICETTSERHTTLRHFRGRQIVLMFAPAGADPFEILTARPSTTRVAAEGQKLLMIGVHEGKAASSSAARNDAFDYLPVADGEGRIAQLYGIRYKPTMVLVDRDGRISGTTVVTPVSRSVRL